MKLLRTTLAVLTIALVAGVMPVDAQAATPNASGAQSLSQLAHRIKNRLQQMLQQSGHGFTAYEDVAENDGLAAGHISTAFDRINESAVRFDNFLLSGNAFDFIFGCGQLSTARLYISNARYAAIQPPLGTLSPFAPELAQMVIDINVGRGAHGC